MSKENDVETLRHIRARRAAYRESITCPELIPRLVDQDPWAQLRRPMDMIRQG